MSGEAKLHALAWPAFDRGWQATCYERDGHFAKQLVEIPLGQLQKEGVVAGSHGEERSGAQSQE